MAGQGVQALDANGHAAGRDTREFGHDLDALPIGDLALERGRWSHTVCECVDYEAIA